MNAAACRHAGIEPNLPGAEDGLLFPTPALTWDEAIPLGNGMMGALVWGDGDPLRISLDRADLWDLRRVSEFYDNPDYSFETMRRWHLEGRTADLVRLFEAPYDRPAPTKIPAGRLELRFGPDPGAFQDSGLELMHAISSTRFGEGNLVECFVHATRPLGLIRVRSSKLQQPALELLAPAFAGEVENTAAGGIVAGDLTQLGYPAPERSGGVDWAAFRQQGFDDFSFAIHVSWSRSRAEWTAVWSIASTFESDDPLQLARQRVLEGQQLGWGKLFEEHSAWWDHFWRKSTVKLPNPVLERQWFLEQYKFGSAARQGAPPVSLQAVWTADDGNLPPWKGDFHHDLNTQLSYWPCYSANRLEEGLGYLDWLWSTREAGFDWTRRFFGLPGLNVPMTTDLAGRQIGGWRQYTHSATTSAWLAQHFYLQWRYGQDREFLEKRAYPYLHDAALFLEAFTAERDSNGLRTFPLSASPEINDNRPEAWFLRPTNYDLALSRWLVSAASELAAELGKRDDAERWRRFLRELPSLSVGEAGLLVAPDHPLRVSHRHFSHLMAIHPLGLLDFSGGPEDRAIVEDSLEHLKQVGTDWWTGYSFAWLANLMARAGRGDEAERALEVFSTAFTLRNSFHCNGDQSGQGYSRFTYRPFTLEGNFAAAAGIQEMLLQSHGVAIQVFPAVPEDWGDLEFTTLRAEGAFLVSARRRAGNLERIEVISEKGGPLRLRSPLIGEELQFETRPGESLVFLEPSFRAR